MLNEEQLLMLYLGTNEMQGANIEDLMSDEALMK